MKSADQIGGADNGIVVVVAELAWNVARQVAEHASTVVVDAKEPRDAVKALALEV